MSTFERSGSGAAERVKSSNGLERKNFIEKASEGVEALKELVDVSDEYFELRDLIVDLDKGDLNGQDAVERIRGVDLTALAEGERQFICHELHNLVYVMFDLKRMEWEEALESVGGDGNQVAEYSYQEALKDESIRGLLELLGELQKDEGFLRTSTDLYAQHRADSYSHIPYEIFFPNEKDLKGLPGVTERFFNQVEQKVHPDEKLWGLK